eukprot:176865-Rhodomonas_salina.1
MGPLAGASRTSGAAVQVTAPFVSEDDERDSASQDDAGLNACNESDEEGYESEYGYCDKCRTLSQKCRRRV